MVSVPFHSEVFIPFNSESPPVCEMGTPVTRGWSSRVSVPKMRREGRRVWFGSELVHHWGNPSMLAQLRTASSFPRNPSRAPRSQPAFFLPEAVEGRRSLGIRRDSLGLSTSSHVGRR